MMSFETFGALIFCWIVMVIVMTPSFFAVACWALLLFGLITVGIDLTKKIPFVRQTLKNRDDRRRHDAQRIQRQEEQERQARIKKEQRDLAQAQRAAKLQAEREKKQNEIRIDRVLKTTLERVLAEDSLGSGHSEQVTVLLEARGALEAGLFFDREDFSVKERIKSLISGKHKFGMLPRSDLSAWSQELNLWSLYGNRDVNQLSYLANTTRTKCSRCGRSVSVQNKVKALRKLGSELQLPDSLYWRQAILNAQWRTLKWQLEPADLILDDNPLNGPQLPVSAAASKYARNTMEAVQLYGEENSPFPFCYVAKSRLQPRFKSFWDLQSRYSDETWEVAKILAGISDRIDDCLECVTGNATGNRSRLKLTPRQREAVMMRDGFRCQNCGRNPREDHVKLHIDHIVPWSKGGSDDMENLQTLCFDCNLGKSDQELV